MRELLRAPITAALATLLLVCGAAHAGPAISLETYADWNTAITGGTVRPMTTTEFGNLQTNNPGFDTPFGGGIYSVPELQAASDPNYTPPGGDTISGPGMYMGWGEVHATDTYTAAWRYEYPLDPNIIGQTLTLTVNPPQFVAGGGQMNSIGIGFTDAAGLVRTWTWNTAALAVPATNTIAWNQNWNVSIGPILGVIPPAVPPDPATATRGATVVSPIYFSMGAGPPFGLPGPPWFNPAMAMWLDGYENGGAPAASMPVPNQGIAGVVLWNWWQNVNVTPEPATVSLLALGACLALFRRRAHPPAAGRRG